MAKTVKTHSVGLALEKLSADPSSPKEGQLQLSDGTIRAAGIWEYRDGAWVRQSSQSASKNFYENGEADNHSDTSKFSTGNNTSFDGGGTVQGVFSKTTTAADLISGDSAFKFVLHATPGTSDDDYVASELIDIDQGYRGREIYIKVQYKYDGADNDIQFVAKRMSDSVLDTNLMDNFVPVSNEAGEFSFSVFVPDDCTQIKVGPQVLTHATGSEVILWDDAIVSPDPFPLSVVTAQIRTMFVNVHATDYTAAVTATTSYKTRTLTSVSGDTYGSVTTNQLSLPVGEYVFHIPIASYNNNQSSHALIYDITGAANWEEFLSVSFNSTTPGASTAFNTVIAYVT